MEEQKRTIISKDTLMPIGLILTMMSAVWFLATMSGKVKMNSARVEAVEYTIKENPGRAEFNDLKNTVNEIRTDVKTLLGGS